MGAMNKASDRRRAKWRRSDSNPTLMLHRIGDRLHGRTAPKPKVINFPETYRYRIGERVQYRRNRWDMTLRYGRVDKRDVGFDGRAIYRVNGEWLDHKQIVDSLSLVVAA